MSAIQLKRAMQKFNDHEFESSMKALSKVVKKFPEGRGALSRYFAEAGARVLNQKRAHLAQPLLKGAIDLVDTNPLAHKAWGDLYLTAGRLDPAKSIYHYERVLQVLGF